MRAKTFIINGETGAETEALLRTAMVDWQKKTDRLSTEQRGGIVRDLDALIEKATRLRGYMDGRYGHGCNDQGHANSVKQSNRLTTKIRRALGFTFPKQEVGF